MAYAPDGDFAGNSLGDVGRLAQGKSRLQLLLEQLMGGGGGFAESPHAILGGHEVNPFGGGAPAESVGPLAPSPLHDMGLVPLPNPRTSHTFVEGHGLSPVRGALQRQQAPGGFHTRGLNLSPRVQALLEQLLSLHAGGGHGPMVS